MLNTYRSTSLEQMSLREEAKRKESGKLGQEVVIKKRFSIILITEAERIEI
jgi:hypothetical protein